MNARKTFLGLAGVALIAASGIFAAGCGTSNPTPSGSGTSTGTSSGSATGAMSGTTSGAGSGTSGSSTGSGTGTSAESSGTVASNDGGPDATVTGTTDAGDGGAPEAAACNGTGAVYPTDACAPCAANLLNACSTVNVTCVPFDNSVIPPDAGF